MRPIEEIAREAASSTCGKFDCDRKWLERFAAIVRTEALEEAAAVCDSVIAECPDGRQLYEAGCDVHEAGAYAAANEGATNIRALKDDPHA